MKRSVSKTKAALARRQKVYRDVYWAIKAGDDRPVGIILREYSAGQSDITEQGFWAAIYAARHPGCGKLGKNPPALKWMDPEDLAHETRNLVPRKPQQASVAPEQRTRRGSKDRRGWHYRTPAERVEVIKAIDGGMDIFDIANITGLPLGTVSSWASQYKTGQLKSDGTYDYQAMLSRKARGPKGAPVVEERPMPATSPPPPPPSTKLTLEEFIAMLRTLLDDYSATKRELETLKKSVEQWKVTAGRLTEQLNYSRD